MGLILSIGAVLFEFLTEGLFIASLMKMLTAVNLVKPKSETLRQGKTNAKIIMLNQVQPHSKIDEGSIEQENQFLQRQADAVLTHR